MSEKPLECSACIRPIAVTYTEVVGDTLTYTSMCQECPVLQRQLYGTQGMETAASPLSSATGVVCGHCGTTLESIRTGNPLGCSECYEVFGDILLQDMLRLKKIPTRLTTPTKKSMPLHHGRSPGEAVEMNPSLRLLALNEALKETLSREDYEQAAWLRDQIKALMENENETEE
jgi:protein arginine kinase activator